MFKKTALKLMILTCIYNLFLKGKKGIFGNLEGHKVRESQ